jgi:phytanoyl-CoA hydroxylase
MLTDEELAHFREQGYVLVPDALRGFGHQRVVEAFDRAQKQSEADWHATNVSGSDKGVYGRGRAAHVMVDLWQQDDLFLDLADNPTVIPAVQQVVGPDLQLTESIGHIHPAGTDAHIEWHRDWPPWSHPTQVLKAKVFYFVDDIDADMGCFTLVPTSHNWPQDPPGSSNSFSTDEPDDKERSPFSGEQLEDMPDLRKITGSAGTALIWNVALWHSATANTSVRDRRMLVYGYTHFWVKHWEDRTPPQQLVQWADTPHRRQLLGIHAVQGRAAWDRHDVDYLPEHRVIAESKPF